MNLTNTRRGFTLIELLVVVLIIGILAAVAVPQYQKAVEKARRAEAVQILHQIHHASQLYKLAGNDYGDGEFLEKADIGWPAELTTEDCFEDGPMCFQTKDWQYVDNTGGDFVAIPVRYLENPPYELGIDVNPNSEDVGRVYCFTMDKTSTDCQKICGSNSCYLD